MMFDRYEEACKIMRCFPGSYINNCGEIILHEWSNTYFRIENCESLMDVKCKVLEHVSRAAYKTEPYSSQKKNREFHAFMLHGINVYLDTDFDENDMDAIYTYLGNACNHEKTVRFVESGYDMSILGG